MSEDKLYISDPNVIAFYKKHNINHDIANKLLVDLLEKVISESQDTMSNMISNEILSNMKLIINNLQTTSDYTKTELSNLRDLVLKMNNDISTTTFNKLLEIKQSYIDDLKSILSNNDASNTLKLSSYE